MARGSRNPRLLVAAAGAVAAAIVVGAIVASSRDPAPTFEPVADAYVDESSPARTFGALRELRVSAQPARQRAYIRFQVAGLAEPAARATLRLMPMSSSPSGIEVATTDDHGWTETGLRFSTAPEAATEPVGSGPAVAGEWLEVDVTSFVAGNGAVSLILSTQGTLVRIGSRESSTRPQLAVEPGRRTAAPPVSVSPSPTATTPGPVVPSAGADSEAIDIAVAGDIACDPNRSAFNDGEGRADECRMKATADLLVGLDAVITLGDNQYEDGTLEKYRRSYDRSWGKHKFKTYPVPGNHDYRNGGAGYYAYFGKRAGDPAKGYYSFDLGKWHVIVLNSNCSGVGGCDRGSPQEVWLREDLAANSKRCTMAAWHHPRFSSGRHGSNDRYDAFWQALYDFDADLVLAGHDHTYERFGPMDPSGRADPARGIRSFVVGTGGRNLYRFEKIEANSEVRNNTTFGVLRLTLSDGIFDWRFVPAAPGTFTDSGTARCH